MQTRKFLFVIGTAAVLVSPLRATAGPDNAAQAKMREALRQKMEELNAPAAPAPAPVAPPAAVIEPVKPAPAPQPKPAVVEELKPMERPATVVVPVPVEPAPVPVAPIVVTPAPVKVPKVEKVESRFSDVPEAEENANVARMREVLRQKLAAEKASTPAPVVVAPAAPAAPAPAVVVAPAAPVKPAAPEITSMPAPVVAQPITANIEVPASPFSGSKQDRLADLLRRYKADEITPQEYHTQRAAIIAEP